jgi:hypothetical protein
MTPWSGKRVQIVGTVISPKAASTSAPPPGASPAAAAPLEFRVQSVQSIAGSCPKL